MFAIFTMCMKAATPTTPMPPTAPTVLPAPAAGEHIRRTTEAPSQSLYLQVARPPKIMPSTVKLSLVVGKMTMALLLPSLRRRPLTKYKMATSADSTIDEIKCYHMILRVVLDGAGLDWTGQE
jgi:hypothetical protein